MYHSLQQFMPIECLLLLKQEDIAGHWNTADSPAVGWVWPWDAIVVCMIRRVVDASSLRGNSRDLRGRDGWTLVEPLEHTSPLHGTRVGTDSAGHFLDCLDWMCHFAGDEYHFFNLDKSFLMEQQKETSKNRRGTSTDLDLAQVQMTDKQDLSGRGEYGPDMYVQSPFPGRLVRSTAPAKEEDGDVMFMCAFRPAT